ncbi:MAG: 50S ribosomal protein L5 [Nitrospiria bacterium]
MAKVNRVTTLKDRYLEKAVPEMTQEFGYKNVMQVPSLEKVVLNVGMGAASSNIKMLDAAVSELALITGQKPVVTKAKKSIAGFKLRQNVPIGCMVTLRRKNMYEFLDRLFHASLPRIRDFRGFSPKSFDGRGNYSLGIKEQLIFPEINYDDVFGIHGLNIVIVTTAGTDAEGRSLLKGLGFPFRKPKEEKVG